MKKYQGLVNSKMFKSKYWQDNLKKGDFWKFAKRIIPFALGLAIGAGLTRNKSFFYILMTYIVIMILFGMFSKKITAVKEAEDKKMAFRNETVKTVNSAIDISAEGNIRGANIFDRYYKDYSFFFGIALFIATIILAISGLWMWALVSFLGLHFHITLNQIARVTREIREGDLNGPL